jgi:hypothetical protein
MPWQGLPGVHQLDAAAVTAVIRAAAAAAAAAAATRRADGHRPQRQVLWQNCEQLLGSPALQHLPRRDVEALVERVAAGCF